MARYLSRYLKPTLLVVKCWSVHEACMPAILMYSDSIVEKVSANTEKRKFGYDESKELNRFVDQFDYGVQVAVPALVKLLSISESNARQALQDYPALKNMQKQQIYENYQTLRTAGLTKSTIKKNIRLLTNDNAELKQKIKLVEKIDINITDAMYLLCLRTNALAKLARQTRMEASYLPANNRIHYLAEKLNCDAGKICQLLIYNPHMLDLPAPKLLSVTELLLDSGITPESIKKDLWAYNYHIFTIKEKIKRAKEIGVKPLKPWVIRCSDHVWEKLDEKVARRQSVLLSGGTIEQHMCEIFQCNLQSVDYLFAKDPALRHVDLDKLSKISQLLHSKGYTIDQVRCSTRIFQRSYRTLQKLFEQWETSGNEQPPKLVQLLVSSKSFQALIIPKGSNVPE